jgi:fructokinase
VGENTAAMSDPGATGRPILCLGEALVDLICERPASRPADVDALVPHPGGAVANAAAIAAQAGARVALAGGVGADAWGDWLRTRLESAGVDLRWFRSLGDLRTPLALATVDETGEASYAIYNQGLDALVPALGELLEEALSASAALFFGSNSLVGAAERELTMRARELALEQGRHVIYEPNLRLPRWRSNSDAQASSLACVPGALLVRVNAAEARLLTGEQDPERAAGALLKAGARMVLVTFGSDGAMLRGEFRADVPAVVARVVSTIGAGDAFTGTVLGELARTGFYPPAVPASMRAAAVAAARACERWGAWG